MTSSRRGSDALQREEVRESNPRFLSGAANGLLISIPLWILLGAILVHWFQEGPMNESVSLAFMIAAAVEAVLVRHALHGLWPKLLRRGARRATREPTSHAAKTGIGPVAYLEKMTGRPITAIEDILRFIAEPQAAGTARVHADRRSTPRHIAGFAALTIAFLQYYFWDVNLQIASLHSVTVFVAVTPLQNFAS